MSLTVVVRCSAVDCEMLSESLPPSAVDLDLYNLNCTVFTECPEALNVDNLNASKITAIVQQAKQCVCNTYIRAATD